MITIALYSEKIAENDRKIEQLSKNIKRDTKKRKKLMEENARLSDADIAELAGSGRSSEDSDDIAFYDKQDSDED